MARRVIGLLVETGSAGSFRGSGSGVATSKATREKTPLLMARFSWETASGRIDGGKGDVCIPLTANR